MLSMVKRLKRNGRVGILIDQKAGGLNSVKVDFFGREAETTTSIALLKKKLNPIIVPFFIVRLESGLYEIVIKELIEPNGNLEDVTIEEMTLSYNQALEEIIRREPTQWFWMHNRWRI
jgi:KDO2-lipid IV(A) lauroyltransferase